LSTLERQGGAQLLRCNGCQTVRWIPPAEFRAGQAEFRRLTEGEGREDLEDPRQAG